MDRLDDGLRSGRADFVVAAKYSAIPARAAVLDLGSTEMPADEKIAVDIPANVVAGLGPDATGACAQDPEEHSSARRPLHTDRQNSQGRTCLFAEVREPSGVSRAAGGSEATAAGRAGVS